MKLYYCYTECDLPASLGGGRDQSITLYTSPEKARAQEKNHDDQWFGEVELTEDQLERVIPELWQELLDAYPELDVADEDVDEFMEEAVSKAKAEGRLPEFVCRYMSNEGWDCDEVYYELLDYAAKLAHGVKALCTQAHPSKVSR